MESTDIEILYLNRELGIERFTPNLSKIFNIRKEDYGRPITDLTHRLHYKELIADARKVLEDLSPVEREVQSQDQRWYLARLRPYRTVDDRIAGVTFTFVDITRIKNVEAALQESQRQLTRELQASRRLHEMTLKVLTSPHLTAALEEILDTAVELLGADFGNIRLFNPQRRGLEIAVQQGFESDFLGSIELVKPEDDLACGRAVRENKRIRIEDVERDEAYAPYRKRAKTAGYRAVQSTPFFSSKGEMLGVLSTHYRQPHPFSESDERQLDLLAGHAANLIDRLRTEEALKELNETLEERVKIQIDEMRKMSYQLTKAEQEERQRIAAILHDDLQQRLYAARLSLDSLRQPKEKLQLAKQIGALENDIDEAMKIVRDLAGDFSPPIVEKEELRDIVGWLAKNVKTRYDLDVKIQAKGFFPIQDKTVRLIVFHVIR